MYPAYPYRLSILAFGIIVNNMRDAASTWTYEPMPYLVALLGSHTLMLVLLVRDPRSLLHALADLASVLGRIHALDTLS